MKKVLYTKYNSTRKPEYQLSTSIIEEDGVKYAVKKAIHPKAKEHLLSLPEKRRVLEKLYKEIELVSCEVKDDTIVFPFVKGKSLLSGIDFQKDDIDVIVEKVKALLEKTMQYSEDCYCSFEMTEEFENYFGYYFSAQDVQAVCPANLDPILGNFVELEDGRLCSIDYEWVAEFPVPVRFIEYRALLYLYVEYEKYFVHKISRDEFILKFGFSERENAFFGAMESNFQQEVFGEGRKYAYLDNYQKKNIKLDQLEIKGADRSSEYAELKRNETLLHLMLAQQNAYTNDLKRMIKNPLFGLKRIIAKLRNDNDVNAQRTALTDVEFREKSHEYKRKYIYNRWIRHFEAEDICDETFAWNPLISILIYVEKLSVEDLKASVESVYGQKYSNWQVFIAAKPRDRKVIEKALPLHENMRIVSADFPLEKADGEYITYLESGDLLRENALYEAVKVMNENSNVDFIYSDEDDIAANGGYRRNPFFKPGWSPDTLMSFWYTGHMAVYRKSIAEEIGGLCEAFTTGKEYDFVLRFTEKTKHIVHIEKVLYHNREKASVPAEILRKVQESTIQRRGILAQTEPVQEMEQSRVIYGVENYPRVSIIIPSKDNYDILHVCVESLVRNTSYKNYEMVLVDNGSNLENKGKYQQLCDQYGIKYIYQEMQFNFSKMCNIGAETSSGEYLVFLNDDIEVVQTDWLERMVGHASLEHIGAVGAKLLYPNSDLIQHTGIVMYQDGPGHAISKYSDAQNYSKGRNRTEYNWLAVTAACMVIKTERFRMVSGFNENLKVAFNDVDLCLKLIEQGYFNVVRNDVSLYHHESLSRGVDSINHYKRTRVMGELELLKYLHPEFVGRDPFYNKNLEQDNVGFGITGEDLTIKDDRAKTLQEMTELPPENSNIMCSVDLIETENEKIYICGWSMIPGSFDNNDKTWNLLLKGEAISYLINTDQDYRPDVADAFPNELLIDYVGFKCVMKKADVQAGVYQLGVIGEAGCRMMDKSVFIC